MKKFIPFLVALLAIVSSLNQVYATHVMGADITYKCNSAKKYTFTLTYYRYCGGVSFSNPSSQTKVVSMKTGSSMGVNLSLVSITDVTPTCKSTSKICYPQNKRSGAGIEAHVYTCTVDFNKAPYNNLLNKGNCEIRLETGQCCRNSNITTGAANENFYTYAILNLCEAPVNNSPQFKFAPVAFLCCNQPYYSMAGGFDHMDFDSLSYSFAHPLSGYNQKINYSGTYAYDKPFDAYYPGTKKHPYNNPNAQPPIGIHLDPTSGALIFTPIKCGERTVAVLEVKEWRKDSTGKPQLIGITRRDLQYYTEQCPSNNPPTLSGKFSNTFKVNPCDDKYCIQIASDDQIKKPPPPQPAPPPDTLSFINVDLPTGVTMRVLDPDSLNPTAELCFDFSVLDKSKFVTTPLVIPVLVQDNSCPMSSITARMFKIYVDTSSDIGKVKGRVIEDLNKNCIENSGEDNLAYIRKIGFSSSTPFYSYTNSDGTFDLCLDTGSQKIALMGNPWFDDQCTSTSLTVRKDSTHEVDFFSKLHDGIAGYVFEDTGNCSSSGSPLAHQMVVAQPGNHYTVTDANGFYMFKVTPGNYKISLVNDTTYWKNRCKDTMSASLVSGTTLFTDTFFNYRKVTYELGVVMGFNTGPTVRKGTDCRGVLNITNNSGQTIDEFTVTVETLSGLVDLSKSSSGWTNPSSGTYQITIKDMPPDLWYRNLYLKTGTGYNTGDSIPFKVYIDKVTTAKDIKTGNNTDSTILRVVAPYDPNRKTATPDSIFTTVDRRLQYFVEFQNEGTASAIDVVIRDTLPEELDLSTLEFNEASHPFTYTLDGNRLWIYFTSINLPTKSNSEVNSKGSVSFSIALNEDVDYEMMVKNRVGIYFDLEDVVLTDYQINHFKSPIELIDSTERTFCPDDTLEIPFITNFKPYPDNKFILEATDSSGKETTFTILDSISSDLDSSSFIIALQDRLGPGDKFKFRIRSTSPKTICFEAEYRQNANIKPQLDARLSLDRTTICYGEQVKVESTVPGFINKLFVNNQEASINGKGSFASDTFSHGASLHMQQFTSEGCVYYTDTLQLSVLAIPSVEIIADSVFCKGSSSVSFGKNLTNGNGFGQTDSIIWSFGDGQHVTLTSSDADPSHEYTAGNYTARLTAFNDVCSDSSKVSIHTGVHPTADFKAPTTALCKNQDFELHHTSSTPFGTIANVEWNLGDGNASTDSSFWHAYKSDGTFDIELIVTDEFGCSDTLVQGVSILEAPTAKIISDKVQTCLDDPDFEFSADLSGSYVSMAWNIEGNSFTTNTVNHSFTSPGEYTIELRALSAGVCHDTASLTVNVYGKEPANFNLPSRACNDEILPLNASTSTATSSYTWDVDGNQLNGAAQAYDISSLTQGIKDVRLLIVTENGCRDSISKKIEVIKRPSVTHSADQVCFPRLTTFDIVPQDVNSGTEMNMIWGDGTETGFTPIKMAMTHAYGEGTYTSKLIITNDFCSDSSEIVVEVYHKPQADFRITPAKTEGDKFSFENTSTGNARNLWNLDGTGFNEKNATNFEYTYPMPGTYSVTLVVESSEGCSDTISKILNAATDVVFYLPNAFSPNNDGLNDHFKIVPEEYIDDIRFALFNRWGEKVSSSDDPNKLIERELPNGLYLYTVSIIDIYGKQHRFQGTINIW